MVTLHPFVDVHPTTFFPVENLPYGVFQPNAGGSARCGVAIGDSVVDLALLEAEGYFNRSGLDERHRVFNRSALNDFMAKGRTVWRKVRKRLISLLCDEQSPLREAPNLIEAAIFKLRDITPQLPVRIGDYTDFYASKSHAANLGTIFRGKAHAVMPNWYYLPVAYHGRTSSIVVSGTDIRRPKGQIKIDGSERPVFSPSQMVDFELEVGFLVGESSALGEPISLKNAADHIFGMVLLNDWSARDIQRWEYQPLGPFLGKNFATSISPWVVPMDALKPFEVRGITQDPEPLPYLKDSERITYDIHLEVTLQGKKMGGPHPVCRSNFQYLYWTIAQQLAHHTVGGCNVRTGDLMASGTISGPGHGTYGSLLELSWNGTRPIPFPNGETRTFIEDGDRITMSGWCEGDGYRVGFGEVTGCLLKAIGGGNG